MRALFLLLLPSLTFATSFAIKPFSQFTQSAPHMVYGIIHNVRTEEGMSEGGKTIFTFADVEIKEVIKGSISAANGIIVRKLGGTKDAMTLDIPGSPNFTEDEETVLFLNPIPDSQLYEVVDMELGKFGIKEENGEKVLTGGIFALSAQEDSHTNSTELTTDLSENNRPWNLNQLKELVHKQTDGNPTPAPSSTIQLPSSDNILTKLFGKNDSKQSSDHPTTDTESKSIGSKYSLSKIAFAVVIIFGALFLVVRLMRKGSKK